MSLKIWKWNKNKQLHNSVQYDKIWYDILYFLCWKIGLRCCSCHYSRLHGKIASKRLLLLSKEMEVGRKENLKRLLLHLLALSRWPKGDRSGSWAVTPLGLSFPCVKYEVVAVALVLDLSVICWRNCMTVWLENGAPSSRQFWGATFNHKGGQTVRCHGFLIAYFFKDVLTQLRFNYKSIKGSCGADGVQTHCSLPWVSHRRKKSYSSF